VSEVALERAPLGSTTRFGVGVAGLGTAMPDTVVSSEDIAARLGVEPDWIVSRTGIRARRHAAEGETLVGFATQAAANALEDGGIAASDVDLVVVATCSADELLPAAAPQVAHNLGLQAAAIDVNAACTGFLSGIALAAGQIETGRASTVVVIGAEVLSRMLDKDDRRTAMLFGDGAGAVVMTRREGPGDLGPVLLASDGSDPNLLHATKESRVIEMEGHEVFKHAVARMGEATLAVCPDLDADLYVYHQANARILRSLATKLGLPADRVVDSIAEHGNTSAASIPLALEAARREGRLPAGTRVLLSAFGAGFTWGAALLDWKPA
jgi:3-oxoacyl-[acyl-carrier-protein] synthase-3